MKYIFILALIGVLVNIQKKMNAQNVTEEFISDIVKEAREKYQIPAISAVIMNSDSILFKVIQGTRIANQNNPIMWEDYFHIGSCSKSILAVITGKMIEDGKLAWDTKFFDVFPELIADAKIEYAAITLEDLFLCQAGMLSYTSGEETFPLIDSMIPNQRLEFVKYLIKQAPASNRNGYKFDHLYSNASYTMASTMLEKISGKNYEQLVQSTLNDLGLSVLIGWPNSISPNQPWGHMITDSEITIYQPDHPYKLPYLILPAGDLSMKPLDYARYTQLHLQGLSGASNYLSSETYNHIHWGFPGFSLGVANGELSGYKYSGFDGSAGTFFCRSIIVLESDFAFTIMMNAGSGGGTMEAVDWLTMKIVKKHYNWWWKFWM